MDAFTCCCIRISKVVDDYAVKLHQSNVGGNNNKFYIIQVAAKFLQNGLHGPSRRFDGVAQQIEGTQQVGIPERYCRVMASSMRGVGGAVSDRTGPCPNTGPKV